MFLLQSTFAKPKVADMLEGHRLVRIGKDFSHASLWVRPIELQCLGFYAVAEAAGANATDQAGQADWIFTAKGARICDGQWERPPVLFRAQAPVSGRAQALGPGLVEVFGRVQGLSFPLQVLRSPLHRARGAGRVLGKGAMLAQAQALFWGQAQAVVAYFLNSDN
ncbi:unnamed protein product [Prorocentrum cordatum]|uniref:Altered inheritance of mitochondria protein 24, mitochondrial n=1 Tax=Prorocentrum cordatum TaxID=2364126 RepID=A0ABN9SM23_9DINO|nr:unnamed protein product [Polarella glacialis]